MPILAGAPEASRIFDVVFFIVVVNELIPGATVRWVTKRLGVEVRGPPPATAVLEITSTRALHSELHHFYIHSESAVCGARLSELPFPQGAAVMLIVRGEELLPAKGDSVLTVDDHVYVFCRPNDMPMIVLLFGRADEE
jgi:cell volume regulation protein A